MTGIDRYVLLFEVFCAIGLVFLFWKEYRKTKGKNTNKPKAASVPQQKRTQATPPPLPKQITKAVEPYRLRKNELPQGKYVIGQDIPAGTYDFFTVYGNGGRLLIAKYDSKGKIIDGTSAWFWVGLKESYEQREVIHVSCKEGYVLEVTGNVILRIAKSQKVCIDL